MAEKEKVYSRRSLLSWLGTGCVLALSPTLGRCISNLGPANQGTDPDTGLEAEDPTRFEFGFQPTKRTQDLYKTWGIRTVDKQNLQRILSTWQLVVDGLVEQPQQFSFADLVSLPRQDRVVDFHCVEGWSVYDVPWNGVLLNTLLEKVQVQPRATHVTFHTIGSEYNESLPIEWAREPNTLLAYGIDGFTIPFDHGFPMRLVIPRLLGYKNAKYVDRIELTDKAVSGFWVKAGYSYDGLVPQSRLRPGKY